VGNNDPPLTPRVGVRPKNLTPWSIARVCVKLISPADNELSCDVCGGQWHAVLKPGGELPLDFWACPVGCNVIRGELPCLPGDEDEDEDEDGEGME
jgi:hypothetical protein